jgi:hypothetical protein
MRYVLWSFMLFGSLTVVCYLLSSTTTEGIISLGWVIYFFEWCVIGALGLIALFLKWIKILNPGKGFIYTFIGVANICNAICGAYMLYEGRHANEMARYWALLGATFCIGFLILVDVFSPNIDDRKKNTSNF